MPRDLIVSKIETSTSNRSATRVAEKGDAAIVWRRPRRALLSCGSDSATWRGGARACLALSWTGPTHRMAIDAGQPGMPPRAQHQRTPSEMASHQHANTVHDERRTTIPGKHTRESVYVEDLWKDVEDVTESLFHLGAAGARTSIKQDMPGDPPQRGRAFSFDLGALGFNDLLDPITRPNRARSNSAIHELPLHSRVTRRDSSRHNRLVRHRLYEHGAVETPVVDPLEAIANFMSAASKRALIKRLHAHS